MLKQVNTWERQDKYYTSENLLVKKTGHFEVLLDCGHSIHVADKCSPDNQRREYEWVYIARSFFPILSNKNLFSQAPCPLSFTRPLPTYHGKVPL